LSERLVGVIDFSFALGVVADVPVVLTPVAEALTVVEFADEPVTLLAATVC
jgi:hypothetical protein